MIPGPELLDALASKIAEAIKRFDAITTAMSCAQEALASGDYRTMRDDLIRAAEEMEAAGALYREAAAYASVLSGGNP